MTDMRTPLARIRGLGSAREGTGQFWAQRLTAVALIPLVLFFLVLLISLNGADFATVRTALVNPFVALMFVLMLVAGLYHMRIGMQIIIEDYIHSEGSKIALIMLNTFFAIVVGVASVYALVKLALGG